jgi:phage shock protein A
MENSGEKRPEDLSGMGPKEAREYIFHHIATLKLTEKELEEAENTRTKWEKRVELARSKGDETLALGAEGEAEKAKARADTLRGEIGELRGQIETMLRQIPGLAARERRIDPDLLEQELLMALGHLPGDEEKAGAERAFKDLEQKTAAETALDALKAKMGRNGGAS